MTDGMSPEDVLALPVAVPLATAAKALNMGARKRTTWRGRVSSLSA